MHRKKEMFLKKNNTFVGFAEDVTKVLESLSGIEFQLLKYIVNKGNVRVTTCLVKSSPTKYTDIPCIRFISNLDSIEAEFSEISKKELHTCMKKLISTVDRFLPTYIDMYYTYLAIYLGVDTNYSRKFVDMVNNF